LEPVRFVSVDDVSAVPAGDVVGSCAPHFLEGELAVWATVVGVVVCGCPDEGRHLFVVGGVVPRLVRHKFLVFPS